MREKIIRWVRENPHCLLLLYFIVYLVWFFALEFIAEPKYWIVCPLDDYIPFNEWFILPYAMWFLYFPGALAYFLFRHKDSFLKLCFVMFTGMTICLFIYTFWPNAIDLRQEITGDSLLCKLALLMRAVDTPSNVCPSIHVSSTTAVHWVISRYNGFKYPRLVKFLSLLLCLSICASTVFLKQHSIVDVFWGVVLTAVLALAVKIWEKRGSFFPHKA